MQSSAEVQKNNGNSPRSQRRTATGHVIESGVPLPERLPFGGKRATGRAPTLDLSGLAVDDSIFLRAVGKPAVARAVSNTASAAKRAGIKTTYRSVDGGIRVWRTA